MITGAESMGCGNCGHGLFHMFCAEKDSDTLYAECAQCKSVSVITAVPHLVIRWGEGAEGILCPMEPNS